MCRSRLANNRSFINRVVYVMDVYVGGMTPGRVKRLERYEECG
jgi:hypothetical protein